MSSKRIGRQSVKFENPPVITASACVGGKLEGEGPLASHFDYISDDAYFGQKSWEDAESQMLKQTFELALKKNRITQDDLDYLYAGDLLNQCVSSAFALKESGAPFFGLFGACSTSSEALSLAAMSIDGGYARSACALTSSHFCTAERQFRTPLAYGGTMTPTAQRTVTAAGAFILEAEGTGPKITHITTGKIVDAGVTDAANMGAAMAPAAVETLCTHFSETGRDPGYYDFIVTGDLAQVGFDLLCSLTADCGYDIAPRASDCGLLIFDREKQNVKAGGSGCGCSASVLAGYLLEKMKSGEINKLLFAPTGALMSPTTSQQGKSVLGICHAVAIENEV
ncbi:MAG: stage V sporulation protein AD [Oscillospiraceae bacterium]|jgi:stage V sporulation protein AD|nr:stage V sporulation protein AD [Oscillospiraceae bacterium]